MHKQKPLSLRSLWVAMFNPICLCQVPAVPGAPNPASYRACGWQCLTLFAYVMCPMFRSPKPRIGWTEPVGGNA